MSSLWAIVTGVVSGAGGAVLLRRIPHGVQVPALACGVLVAALWAVVSLRLGGLPLWWWPVPLLLAWAGVLLGAADVAVRRLPNAITLPAYPVVAVLLGVAAAGVGDADLLVRALGGAMLWAGGYAAVRLIAPSALGGGDIKLAGSLGALTAASSWPGLLLAILAANALTVVVAGFARICGYAEIPHGPPMLAAAWLITFHPPG